MIGRLSSLLRKLGFFRDSSGQITLDDGEGGSTRVKVRGDFHFFDPDPQVSDFSEVLGYGDVEGGVGQFGVRNPDGTWGFMAANEFDVLDVDNYLGSFGILSSACYFKFASGSTVEWTGSATDCFAAIDTRFRRASAGVVVFDDGAGGAGEVRAAKVGLAEGVFFTSYAGSPENNVAANKGAICSDTTNAKLYFKTTDTVSTGWVEMARV